MGFSLATLSRRCVRSALDTLRTYEVSGIRKVITEITCSESAPDTDACEDLFDQVQSEFPPFDEAGYAYDSLSLSRRGKRRASAVLGLTGRKTPRLQILEAGCGDGLAGLMLSRLGHEVVLADIEDWRDQRSRSLAFLLGRLESGLCTGSDRFDIVFSYNTFEHVEDPSLALRELLRVCRPQGLVFLEFGPLYASPWGLHAYRMLRMPYPQFLFSEAFIDLKLKEIGIRDLGRKQAALQPLNRWRLAQFTELWTGPGCQVLQLEVGTKCEFLQVVRRFPRCFTGRHLSFDDLTVSSIRVVLRKL